MAESKKNPGHGNKCMQLYTIYPPSVLGTDRWRKANAWILYMTRLELD